MISTLSTSCFLIDKISFHLAQTSFAQTSDVRYVPVVAMTTSTGLASACVIFIAVLEADDRKPVLRRYTDTDLQRRQYVRPSCMTCRMAIHNDGRTRIQIHIRRSLIQVRLPRGGYDTGMLALFRHACACAAFAVFQCCLSPATTCVSSCLWCSPYSPPTVLEYAYGNLHLLLSFSWPGSLHMA